MKRKHLSLLATVGPYAAVILLLVIVPLVYVAVMSTMTRPSYGGVVYQVSFSGYRSLFEKAYLVAVWNSVRMSLVSTLIILLVSYPMAFILARCSRKLATNLIILMMVPYFTNSLVRLYSYITLFNAKGILSSFLSSLGYTGSLTVGVGVYEYCSTEGIFSDFLNRHPEIKVDILQYPYSILTEKLRAGELNMIIGDALCEDAFSRLGLQSRELFSSPNYIVASPEIAGRHDNDVRRILESECIITTCENTGPSSLRMLRTLFQDEFGFVPANISQTNSLDAQLMLVRARHGVAMVPGFIVDAQCAGLARFELPSRRLISYRLMCLKNSSNPAVQKFFDFI